MRDGGGARQAVERRSFGSTPEGEPVEVYTLREPGGLELSVLTYGAIVQQLWAPDREGSMGNVVLGFRSLDDYITHGGHRVGAVVGRYANRIAGGRFELDGVVHELSQNERGNTLHGGAKGFDSRVWQAIEPDPGEASLTLRYTSPDGEMGFPGTLVTEVVYRLEERSLHVEFRAATDAPTVVNLASHAYWNLAGEGSGSVDRHLLTLFASAYTPSDENLIPTGEISPVAGARLDFRRPVQIGGRMRHIARPTAPLGYDHNFVLDGRDGGGLVQAARVEEPSTGRTLDVLTTEPGIQLYTGNALGGAMQGTSGRPYGRGGGVALETQHFPDSPNRPRFPSTVVRPGERFASTTVFRLGTDGRWAAGIPAAARVERRNGRKERGERRSALLPEAPTCGAAADPA